MTLQMAFRGRRGKAGSISYERTVVVVRVQMVYLEKKINDTFIASFNELKTIVAEAAIAADADGAAPPPTQSPSPANSTTNISLVEPEPVVSPEDEAQSWAEMALEAVNR